MKRSKNILTDKEMELVSLLMADCQSTGDIQTKLKRLFAGTIEYVAAILHPGAAGLYSCGGGN